MRLDDQEKALIEYRELYNLALVCFDNMDQLPPDVRLAAQKVQAVYADWDQARG